MDIHDSHMDVLFNTLSTKYGVRKDIVKDIVVSQFDCLKQTMKKVDSYNGFYPYIKFMYLCIFSVSKNKQKYFTERSKKKIEDVYNQIGEC